MNAKMKLTAPVIDSQGEVFWDCVQNSMNIHIQPDGKVEVIQRENNFRRACPHTIRKQVVRGSFADRLFVVQRLLLEMKKYRYIIQTNSSKRRILTKNARPAIFCGAF